jgi:hypothetical protein
MGWANRGVWGAAIGVWGAAIGVWEDGGAAIGVWEVDLCVLALLNIG